jgi:hypothetical protein
LPVPPAAVRAAIPTWQHALVVGVFAILGISFQVERAGWKGAPDAVEGDLGSIASFAAALDHPECFTRDAFLADSRNFNWYATLHVPLARWLRPLVGSYAGVYLAGYGATVFAHLLGFYLLGLALFGSLVWSVVMAFLALAPVSAGIVYDGWGLFVDPMPRLTFSALTGFLLAGAVRWRCTPKAWPLLMLAAGGATYIHLLSAPVFGLMLWLGLWAYRPPHWSTPGWLARMIGLGLLFALPAVPVLAQYVTLRQFAPSGADPLMQEVYRYRFIPQILNVWYSMKLTVKALLVEGTAAMGLIGLLLLLRSARREAAGLAPRSAGLLRRLRLACAWRRGMLGMPLLWLAAVVGAAAVPLMDYALAVRRGTVMMEVDGVRNVRFFVPVLLVLFLWGLVELERGGGRAAAWSKLGLLAAVGWFAWHGGVGIVTKPAAALQVCRTGQPADLLPLQRAQAAEALRQLTPAQACVLPFNYPEMIIRHATLRPVVHGDKEGCYVMFARRQVLVDWYERQKHCDQLNRMPAGPARLGAIIQWAGQLGAQYILIDEPHPVGEPLAAPAVSLWSNARYSLLSLAEAVAAGSPGG